MVNLNVVKSADKNYVFRGISCQVKYSIIITNTGDSKATFVKVRDVLGGGACFIPGTVMINGCKQNILRLDDDITIGSIQPGGNTLITFDIRVLKDAMIDEIANQAIVTYYDELGNVKTAPSNTLIIPVIKLNVCVQKTVDKKNVCIHDVLNYSVIVRNNSNLAIDNVVLYDELPDSVNLYPASVLINSIPQYLGSLNGIPLGTLAPYASTMISFQVEVISLPATGIVENVARVEYDYTMLESGIPVTSIGESCSNKVITSVINGAVTC